MDESEAEAEVADQMDKAPERPQPPEEASSTPMRTVETTPIEQQPDAVIREPVPTVQVVRATAAARPAVGRLRVPSLFSVPRPSSPRYHQIHESTEKKLFQA